MRDLKFRGWDSEQKEMSLPFEIGSMLSEFGWDILLQFTGLHDKNGKEIYDADVMLWPDGYKQIIGFNEKHTETSVRDIETSFGYHFDSQHPVDKGNIIGNIYENPELLEAVK